MCSLCFAVCIVQSAVVQPPAPAVVNLIELQRISLAVIGFGIETITGELRMKFNKFQLGVLAIGLVAFLLLAPKTESAFVDMIVLADIVGRLFGNRR